VSVEILQGDVLGALDLLPDESVHCVVTSPPYWGLRDYGTAQWIGGYPTCDHRSPTMREGRNEDRAKLAGSSSTNSGQLLNAAKAGVCGICGAARVDQQIGLEPTLGEHLETMVRVFREVRRVLRKDGTLWLNYGDCYATSPNGRKAADVVNDDRTFRDKPFSTIGGYLKAKDRALLPARVAIALQEDGWWVRDEIIWHKPNPMPVSVKDRTTPAHEMIYMFSRSARYYYDQWAIKEPITTDPKENYPARAKITGRGTQGAAAARGADRDKSGGFPLGKRKSDKQQDIADASNPSTQRTMGGFNDRWNERERNLAAGKGNAKTFRGGGAYTQGQSFDNSAVAERESHGNIPNESGLRNKRSVWTVAPKPFKQAHFATFPPDLIRPCILAGCPEGGTVLDPFFGAGTTGLVAHELGRNCIGIELNPDYVLIAAERIGWDVCGMGVRT
jgi:DNA modification methylase